MATKETKEKKPSKKKEKKADKEEAAPAPAAEPEPEAAPPPAVIDEPPPPAKKKESKKSREPSSPPKSEPPAAAAADDEQREDKQEESKAHEPRRAQRATSNVFALFNQGQIQEFKEAFTMIDQNRDGLIDVQDLRAIYTHIGREPDAKVLEEMVAEAPAAINFTMFLGMFGDRLKGTDPESTLRDAFIMFDTEGKGKLNEEYVKDLLMNVGDQFSREEIKQVWKEAPIDGGMLDYLKFVQIMKRGKESE